MKGQHFLAYLVIGTGLLFAACKVDVHPPSAGTGGTSTQPDAAQPDAQALDSGKHDTGDASDKPDGGAPDADVPLDGSAVDAGDGSSPDAAVARLTPAAELTAGAGRIRGATYTMDVQIGHSYDQRPIAAGGKQIQGGAAIKP